MLLKCCAQYVNIWKTQQWLHNWIRSAFTAVSKDNAKGCSKYCTIQVTSHANEIVLKNPSSQVSAVCELRTSKCTSWVQKRHRNQREVKLPTFLGSWRMQSNSRKTSISASLTILKSLIVLITTDCEQLLKKPEYLTTLFVS